MRHAKKKVTNVKSISLQALEQRLLLDGAAVVTVAEAAAGAEQINNDLDDAIDVLPAMGQVQDKHANSELELSKLLDDSESEASNNDSQASATEGNLAQSTTNEIVIIDSAIANP